MLRLEGGTELIRCLATGANLSSFNHLRQECLSSLEVVHPQQKQHFQQHHSGWHGATSLVHVRLARTMPPFPKAACRSKAPPHNPATLHVLPFRNYEQEMRDASTPDQLRYSLPKYMELTPSSATERLMQLPRIMSLFQHAPQPHVITPSPAAHTGPTTAASPATALSQLASAVAPSPTPSSSTTALPSLHSLATSILTSLPNPSAQTTSSAPSVASTSAIPNSSSVEPRVTSPEQDLDICRDLFERSITLLNSSLHLFSPKQLASCLNSIGQLHAMSMQARPELRISDRIHAILIDGSGAELRAAGAGSIADVMQGLAQLGLTDAGHWQPVLAACSAVPATKWSERQRLQIRESLTWAAA